MMSEFDEAFKRSYLETMYPSGDAGMQEMGMDSLRVQGAQRDEENRLRQADMGLKGRAVADTAAGVVKGMVSGAAGFPGDLAAIGRGIYEMGAQGAEMGVLDAFLYGLNEGLILPTTEDVSKFLAENLGPIVPDDVEIDSVREFRESRAERGELAGEILAPGAVLTGAVKAGAKVLGAAKRGAQKGAK